MKFFYRLRSSLQYYFYFYELHKMLKSSIPMDFEFMTDVGSVR